MKYEKTIQLKNGKTCLIRGAGAADGAEMHASFQKTHGETDYLLSYPDEDSFDAQSEAKFLDAKEKSPDEIELCAVVDGRIVGSAGIEAIGRKEKVRHRADFGISVEKEYWGLGIGRTLTEACVQCAKDAGYVQLELEAVAENKRAIALYESVGFTEYGRNPKGFRSRITGWQEIVLMRLELKNAEEDAE